MCVRPARAKRVGWSCRIGPLTRKELHLKLASRAAIDPSQFVDDFLDSLAPGVLPAAQFIDWAALDAVVAEIIDPAGSVEEVRRRVRLGESPASAIVEVLTHDADPYHTLAQLFYLLGHTRPVFVTYEYELDVKASAKRILAGDVAAAHDAAEALFAAGIGEVLRAGSIGDVAMGIRIGLDTHRRKSTGGAAFSAVINELLDEVIEELMVWDIELTKEPEKVVRYGENLPKTVDYALLHRGEVVAVMEINFYTGGGSKPSEVSRAYADLSEKFAAKGIPFIWITDGRGWRDMRNVVREMPLQVPNVYTTKQARQHLANDLRALLT